MFKSIKPYHKKAKRKKSNKIFRGCHLKSFANKLNKFTPKSELWFRDLYKEHFYKSNIDIENDKYNLPIGRYIYDMVNQHFRYAVEVDGSYHERFDQKLKDAKKDFAMSQRGYTLIRITAYSEESFKEGLNRILELRQKPKAHV